jgi:type II secretory ATPase GspE/PulE/Tfp pilus assembly ATPase PilB-like protein/DNA-binding NarL/FixJ family response regulator
LNIVDNHLGRSQKNDMSHVVVASAHTAVDNPSSPETPLHHRHTILFVDDEPRVLTALKRAFADDEYDILTAPDAASALKLLSGATVTMIISDNNMPGMCGTEFLKIVRQKYPQTIRIMLTGVQDTEIVMSAVNEGAVYKFITKPWNNDDLRLTINLAIKQYDLIQENQALRRTEKRQQNEILKLKRFIDAGRSTLGQLLVARGLLLPGQLEMVEKYCRQRKVIVAQAIIELGMIGPADLIRVIQDESKADFIDLDQMEMDHNLSHLLPRDVCQAGCLVPFRLEDNHLLVAVADPLDLARIDYLNFVTHNNVSPRLALPESIGRAICRLYDEADGTSTFSVDGLTNPENDDSIDILLEEEETETPEQLVAKSSTPPAVMMVNSIIAEAMRVKASDIHIEPKSTHSLVRFRIDGLLHDHLSIPSSIHITAVSRLKILAKMDIAERRLPQDGRITVKSHNKIVDLRVSSLPTIHGEKMVMRLLDTSAPIRSLFEIGVGDRALDRLRNIVAAPEGMIISTGPTGSGKTSTLYSLMQERLSPSLNFVTIEDPVEYMLEKASQVHIHHKTGLTFASSLRATLRQDPDVVLVGEIRDTETAESAFQAAMTGHLVLTSLHTKGTISTISRLLHLGIQPYLVASAVQGIIAQRLVRTICPECKESAPPDIQKIKALGLDRDHDRLEVVYAGRGCPRCGMTGYAGRTGLFEVFQMNEEFRHFLTSDYHESRLLDMARSLGMETLMECGRRKVTDGVTTLDELLRVIGPAVEMDYLCKSCHARLDLKFQTCPYCGIAQWRTCPICHGRLDTAWIVCPYCAGTEKPLLP